MSNRELTNDELSMIEDFDKKSRLAILKWFIFWILVSIPLAFGLFFVIDAFAQEPTTQPIMSCADLSQWNGEITFYKWDGLVQFDTTPRTVDRASILEWEAVEVDYYATFRPLMHSTSFRFEAVINFTGTDAHLWIVSNGDDYWAWPFASYELGADGNTHPCGAYQIESYEHQLLFGALFGITE
jgi:hypothetical protein